MNYADVSISVDHYKLGVCGFTATKDIPYPPCQPRINYDKTVVFRDASWGCKFKGVVRSLLYPIIYLCPTCWETMIAKDQS